MGPVYDGSAPPGSNAVQMSHSGNVVAFAWPAETVESQIERRSSPYTRFNRTRSHLYRHYVNGLWVSH
jgi:hypothetical protein